VIVFDLRCGAGHVFEAWFGSSAGYEEQRAGGLVTCPFCGSSDVAKAVMAPNIGAKGNRKAETPVPPPAAQGAGPGQAVEYPPELVKAAMTALAAAQAKALEGSEWVGKSFANRARAMHLGEEAHAPIHGEATAEQAKELIDDGVQVAPLPLPVVPPGARN